MAFSGSTFNLPHNFETDRDAGKPTSKISATKVMEMFRSVADDGLEWLYTNRAPLASPTFTGTPAAPTASAGTNTTQIATTAFVTTAVANVVDGAPSDLDTLNELAAAINDDASYHSTVTTALGTKADASTTISAGGLLTGGGSLAANRTITLTAASQAQAEAGTDTSTAMTPQRVKQAIDALSPAGPIPSGTIMLFQQTSAPTGWTKLVSNDNAALRLVTGTASTGGTYNFTSVFQGTNYTNSAPTGGNESHSHTVSNVFVFNASNIGGYDIAPNGGGTGNADLSSPSTGLSGSGSSHQHVMDLAVKYVDVIAASRD